MISARSSGVKVLNEGSSLTFVVDPGHIVAHGALAQLAVLVRLVGPRSRLAIFQIRLALVCAIRPTAPSYQLLIAGNYPEAATSRRETPRCTQGRGSLLTDDVVQPCDDLGEPVSFLKN